MPLCKTTENKLKLSTKCKAYLAIENDFQTNKNVNIFASTENYIMALLLELDNDN